MFDSSVVAETVPAEVAEKAHFKLDQSAPVAEPNEVAEYDAILVGTPARIEGRDEVATFFNGSAQSALPVFVGDRPSSAWFHRSAAKVVFDFTVSDGLVQAITFRAAPDVLSRVVRRDGDRPRR